MAVQRKSAVVAVAVAVSVVLFWSAGLAEAQTWNCGAPANQYGVVDDGFPATNAVKCEYNLATGIMRISGTGAMANYGSPSSSFHYIDPPPWPIEYIAAIIIEEGVTSIGSNSFAYSVNLMSVEIPNGVTVIGERAFANCKRLKSIEIPDGVTAIDAETFEGCDSLVSINIPGSVTWINFNAFRDCHSLVSIEIPSSVRVIWHGVFHGCRSLKSVTIHNGVIEILGDIFAYCHSLTSITIPASLERFSTQSLFQNCTSLVSINVAPENQIYSSVDGVLFDKTGTNLIKYPEGKEGSYAVPSSVTNIGHKAFAFCNNLTSVTIPNSVTSIGGRAFYGCTNLDTVTIGNSVTSIGHQAFFNCTKLERVISLSHTPPVLQGLGYQDVFGWDGIGRKTFAMRVPKNSIASYYAGWDGGVSSLITSINALTYPLILHYNYYDSHSLKIESTNYYYGEDLTLPNSTIEGYDIVGWYDNEELSGKNITEIAADETGGKEFWAKWVPTTYTVEFVDWNDTVLETQTDIVHGTSATPPADPTRVGYVFTGWSPAYDNVTASITVTAQYSVCTHTWGDWETTTAATCVLAGGKTRTCSVCGAADTDVIAALEHSMPADWTLGEITLAATCQSAGSQNLSKSCTRVGCTHSESSTQSIAVDPSAHNLLDLIAIAATCTDAGRTAGVKCNRSGCTHNTSQVIPALGGAECTGVASSDRNIPQSKPDAGAAVVMPINSIGFEITVGPNPVRKSDSGIVNIFITGKRIDNGTLTVYDATGNVVRKISIADVGGGLARPADSNVRRIIGNWDLKDGKGNNVSAGSYLLRGTVKTIDGNRERVSVVVGVR